MNPNVPSADASLQHAAEAWAALSDAVARSDFERLSELLERYEDLITANFDAWCRVPVEIREDLAKVQVHVTTLLVLAEYCAERGDPGPLARVCPPGMANPHQRWPAQLAQAEQLMHEGQLAAAEALLDSVLADIATHSGPALDVYRANAEALMGLVLARAGRLALAEAHLERAYPACIRNHDLAGAEAVCRGLSNLRREHGDLPGQRRWLREANRLAATLRAGSARN
jgi:hypothetical protein